MWGRHRSGQHGSVSQRIRHLISCKRGLSELQVLTFLHRIVAVLGSWVVGLLGLLGLLGDEPGGLSQFGTPDLNASPRSQYHFDPAYLTAGAGWGKEPEDIVHMGPRSWEGQGSFTIRILKGLLIATAN
jgi:hypothetical protein